MELNQENKALLNLNLKAAAMPAITFIKPSGLQQMVPQANENKGAGFAVELETAVPFDELSRVLHTYLNGKRFELSEGFIKQHVVVEAAKFIVIFRKNWL